MELEIGVTERVVAGTEPMGMVVGWVAVVDSCGLEAGGAYTRK